MRWKKLAKAQHRDSRGGTRSSDNDDDDEETKKHPSSASDPSTVTCFSFFMHDCSNPAEKLLEAPGQWRETRRAGALRLERQLRARWALDDLVDAELARYRAHYLHRRRRRPSSSSAAAARPRDVARLLAPPWAPPLEHATLAWLGDHWRPSAVIALVPLVLSSSSSSAASRPLSPRAHRALSEAARRVRAQEAVLDEEMAEYQSTCILKLPFGLGGVDAVAALARAMRTMEGVAGRAQRLRYRALEVAVKGVLDRTQAAEFLVAFAGIQDLIHRHAARWRARAGPVSVTLHAFNAAIH